MKIDNNNLLDEFRQEIDAVDKQIISLLAKRFEIVRKVGAYKAERNIPPLDQERWREVLLSKMKQAKLLNLSEALVKDIYERIHKEALKLEKKV
jgi:chorismate mutase